MTLPERRLVRAFDTHRLMSSRLLRVTALERLVGRDEAPQVEVLRRAVAARPGAVQDRLSGIPYADIVDAVFRRPNPMASRFAGGDRGAWYAAFELTTAQAEVGYHRTRMLAEHGVYEDTVEYFDFLADFSAELHDLRGDGRFADCLAPESYVASQTLARRLFEAGSVGIVYPSVRHAGGNCIAAFYPELVVNVRRGPALRFRWTGGPTPTIEALA